MFMLFWHYYRAKNHFLNWLLTVQKSFNWCGYLDMNLETFLRANLVSLLNLHDKRRDATMRELENSVT